MFYGAAQVSKDVDFAILAEEENLNHMHAALAELRAERIAIPPFDLAVLARGHAITTVATRRAWRGCGWT